MLAHRFSLKEVGATATDSLCDSNNNNDDDGDGNNNKNNSNS